LLRYVLVPGLTDDLGDIARIACFASSLENVERVDVLPFHQLGQFKWTSLGLRYALGNVGPPTPELVERVRGLFLAEGLKAF